MGGRREVSVIFYRPVTRSDLKQERSFFRGSVLSYLQLVVARLADEAKEMTGMSSKKQKFHHNLASSVLKREDNSIDQLLTTLRNFTDPFKEDGNELFNLVTKVIMPKKVKNE